MPLGVGRRDVAPATKRLEQVEVVVAARRVALAAARLDVMHLEPSRARAALLARVAVSRERARTRVTPEVVVDEVGATLVAAPSSSTRGQAAPAPRARAGCAGAGVSLSTRNEQPVDLGHRSPPPGWSTTPSAPNPH
jgi:hypothetical protein